MTKDASDKFKNFLFYIPNYKLMPYWVHKKIFNEYLINEPNHIKRIIGSEDEISDYLLYNVKHYDIFLRIQVLSNWVMSGLTHNDRQEILKHKFNPAFTKYIDIICDKYIKDENSLDISDESLAEKVYDRVVIKLMNETTNNMI